MILELNKFIHAVHMSVFLVQLGSVETEYPNHTSMVMGSIHHMGLLNFTKNHVVGISNMVNLNP